MGSARSILQQAEADLALLESYIPLNDLDRQAFSNALDEATSAIATALEIIAPDEDWDVLGFRAFLAREKERKQKEQNAKAISHLQTPFAS